MDKKVYHHILYININDKILSHNVMESEDNIDPDSVEAYEASYNKLNQVYRVSYYTYENSKFAVRDYIIQTFRSKCKWSFNGINNYAI